ncbi:hypothetical protein RhiirA1_475849 [Rhizophagus irregularis]|uniref:Uncharacterized protein n=1 Tax=Rhizophagus irregularis TaxID=588596 RepID=A0A2N0QW74_9GLOM|nr:hypothetical protein RhiirA1_475849 [Rhizophagus irregularis]
MLPFFCIAAYFQSATYHITFILPHWYLEPNIKQETLLQQISAIILYSITNSEKNHSITNSTFNNPNITKHKERLLKRLQSFVEQTSKGKHVLKIDINNNENAEGGSKGCKYRRYK